VVKEISDDGNQELFASEAANMIFEPTPVKLC
jgi:hypothetical protein